MLLEAPGTEEQVPGDVPVPGPDRPAKRRREAEGEQGQSAKRRRGLGEGMPPGIDLQPPSGSHPASAVVKAGGPGPMEVDDGAGDGPVAGPVGVKRRVPRFQVVRVVEHLDQARRVVTETVTGDAPLAEDEEWRIVWSRVPEYRLRYRPELDLVFPWRDPVDPLRRVYERYAGADRRLAPGVVAHHAELAGSRQRLRT